MPMRAQRRSRLDKAADQVVAGRRARLRLEEVVVDDVERADAEGEPREPGLGERAAATRVAAALLLDSADGW